MNYVYVLLKEEVIPYEAVVTVIEGVFRTRKLADNEKQLLERALSKLEKLWIEYGVEKWEVK